MGYLLTFALLFGTLAANADDNTAAISKVARLPIKYDSVYVKSFTSLGSETRLRIELAFEINPANSCQENYIGFSEDLTKGLPRYEVLYAYNPEAPCASFGKSRAVTHILNVKMETPQTIILIHGRPYRVEYTDNGQTLKIAQLPLTAN